MTAFINITVSPPSCPCIISYLSPCMIRVSHHNISSFSPCPTHKAVPFLEHPGRPTLTYKTVIHCHMYRTSSLAHHMCRPLLHTSQSSLTTISQNFTSYHFITANCPCTAEATTPFSVRFHTVHENKTHHVFFLKYIYCTHYMTFVYIVHVAPTIHI